MIIYKYILKNNFYPFIFAVFVLMSIFMLQFFMNVADILVGKGLEIWIIVKLIAFNLSWMLILVVPMAVLVATLMAFGGMSQSNEVSILKASGMSLYKMMIPPLAGGIIIAICLTLFYNHVYPYANHGARILRYDVSQKKPALTLVPGVFSQDVSNYSILVRDIDQKNNELKKLTIYDNTNPRNTAIVTAEKGKLYFSKKNDKLIMDLWYGEIHSASIIDRDNYRKVKFAKHKIVMDASQFSFRESDLRGRKTERELGAQVMAKIVDSLNILKENYVTELNQKISVNILKDSLSAGEVTNKKKPSYKNVLRRVDDKLSSAKSTITSSIKRIEHNIKSANSYLVEINKHYAIPFACIVFVLIGAPLGTMTRKSGIGVAAAISLVFFLVYWAFLIGGEKLADRGIITPFWGMWSANIVLSFLGIYLTIKSAKERITIDFDFLLKIIPKQWRMLPEDDQNN